MFFAPNDSEFSDTPVGAYDTLDDSTCCAVCRLYGESGDECIWGNINGFDCLRDTIYS